MKKEQKQKKNSVFRKITGAIGYVMILAIIGLLVFVIGSNVTGNTVFIFGRTTAWVMTPSMEPTIPARSYILVKKVGADEIKKDDVIVFASDDPDLNGAYNTHRVVEIKDGGREFVTKGDANAISDVYTAKAEKVLGVYEKNLPALTAIGRFVFSSIGMMISLTAIFVIVMAIYIPDIIRANRERTKEIERKRREQIDALVREEVERLKAENAKIESENNPESDKEEPRERDSETDR